MLNFLYLLVQLIYSLKKDSFIFLSYRVISCDICCKGGTTLWFLHGYSKFRFRCRKCKIKVLYPSEWSLLIHFSLKNSMLIVWNLLIAILNELLKTLEWLLSFIGSKVYDLVINLFSCFYFFFGFSFRPLKPLLGLSLSENGEVHGGPLKRGCRGIKKRKYVSFFTF